MFRALSSCVASCLLLALTTSCAPKTTPDAAALPQPPERHLVADPAPDAAGLLLRRAAVLRAEDRRVVDAALEAEIGASDAGMRALAVAALGKIGDGRYWDRVAAAANDPHPEVRAAAAFALGLFEDPRGVASLRKLASDSEAAVRRNTVVALGFLHADETLSLVLDMLEDDDLGVALSAADAATRFADFDPIVTRLLSLADAERAPVAVAAVRALAKMSSRTQGSGFSTRQRARERLIELAGANSAELRAVAASGLALPTGSDEIATLAELFKDDDPRVRVNVVDSVSFPGAPVDPFLGQAVLDPDERVVLAALRGLGRLRGMAATNVLAGFLVTDTRHWLRAEAVRALREVEPLELANMAKSAAQAPEPELREAAAGLLVGLDEAGAIDVARLLLADPEPRVRRAAVPAVAGAREPLAELFDGLIDVADPAMSRAVARAARIRLGMAGQSAEDRDATVALLEKLWRQSSDDGDPATLREILDAAARGGEHAGSRAILRAGTEHVDRFVALQAREHWSAVVGAAPAGSPPPATDHPLEHYAEILKWAATPRAAVITVVRPGFIPGRFTVRLNTEQTPLTAWNFAKLAEAGFYDGMPFQRLVPNSILQTGDPDGDGLGGPGHAIRDEIHPHGFRAGTLAMVSTARDGSGSRWLVTLDASPALGRRHTAFGQVVQNFPGVVTRILPTDRVVSIAVYEGNGTERLPPVVSPGLS